MVLPESFGSGKPPPVWLFGFHAMLPRLSSPPRKKATAAVKPERSRAAHWLWRSGDLKVRQVWLWVMAPQEVEQRMIRTHEDPAGRT